MRRPGCTSEQGLTSRRLEVGCSEVLVDEASRRGGRLCELFECNVVEAVAIAAYAISFCIAVLEDLVGYETGKLLQLLKLVAEAVAAAAVSAVDLQCSASQESHYR